MILLTGPTGNTGREILRLASEAGLPLRCMSSRPSTVDELGAQGISTVLGNFDQPETLDQALAGVEKAYLVCRPDQHLETRERNFIDAAARAGVKHLVKLSAFWAAPGSESPNLDAHGRVEEHLRESGVPFTILRPHGFFQTFFWMSAPTIQAQGAMAVPAGQGIAPLLDLRDVAQAAFNALSDDSHIGKTYDLTGPEALSMADMASQLGDAMGRPIQYVDMPEEQLIGGMKMMGVADSSIQHVATVFRWIREGKSEEISDGLQALGVTPRHWKDCAADLVAGRTGAATSFEPPA